MTTLKFQCNGWKHGSHELPFAFKINIKDGYKVEFNETCSEFELVDKKGNIERSIKCPKCKDYDTLEPITSKKGNKNVN